MLYANPAEEQGAIGIVVASAGYEPTYRLRDLRGTTSLDSVVSQIEIFALGGKRTSGYWSHRQYDAQIVSNLTSVQRRLKLFSRIWCGGFEAWRSSSSVCSSPSMATSTT